MTNSPPGGQRPAIARARAAAVTGVDGHLVDIEVEVSNGPPAFRVLGLPGTAVRETRDRVRAAMINSGQRWPTGAVTIRLLPASLPKRCTGFDLAIAVAVLAATGVVPVTDVEGCVFIAELGLNGGLRPVRGVLPALLAAASAGCTRAVIAAENSAEAVIVPGLAVIACQSLTEVVAWLRGEPLPPQPGISALATPDPEPALGVPPVVSPASLAMPPQVRLALEASAAGGHHLCLTGPRGSRIPAIAIGLAALLPPLRHDEAIEVTAIHSVAGLLSSGHPLVTRPPLRAPHHTATSAAILGGGQGITRPGDAALAHRGVLFLDDAPEFAADVLAALRQPLQTGEIVISRGHSIVRLPARFTLIAGMAPCPCGGRPGCACTPLYARRYRARLVGQLGSWIPLWLQVAPPSPADEGGQDNSEYGDALSVARIAAARDRARRRLRDTPWQLNADIPGAELRRAYQTDAEALAPLRRAVDLGEISQRAMDEVLRVAWTLADLAGRDRPGPAECGQALALQLGVAR